MSAPSATGSADLRAESATERYLRLHRQLRGGARQLLIAANDPVEFWRWYADACRGAGVVTLARDDEKAPGFPEPGATVGVWLRGTPREPLECGYTRHALEHVAPRFHRDLDHAAAGPLSNVERAAIAAGAGHPVTYLDLSLDVLLPPQGPGADRTPAFLDVWNLSHPDHRVRSLCAAAPREEVLRLALGHGMRFADFSDCDTGDGWCGDCFGCFELFYCAKAIGRDPGFWLTPRVFDVAYGHHYRTYLASGFAVNHRSAMQRLLRLHARGQIRFDRTADCGSDAQRTDA